MSAERLAYRYAKSLVDLAKEQGSLDLIKGDIENLITACETRDFVLMLKSPIVSKMKKAGVLEELFGDGFNDMTMSFMDILLTKGREMYIPEIAQEFIGQYNVINKISKVKLTTAESLTDTSLEAIRTKLQASGELDTKVELETAVDKEIIGGFKLEFNNRLYDASVQHKLNLMKKALA